MVIVSAKEVNIQQRTINHLNKMACCRCGNSIICHVFTILIIAAGVVMSCLTIYDCKFLTTSTGDTIGLWASVNLDDQCVMNNGDPYGWLQTWARISAVVAPCLGVTVIIMIMVEFCSDHFCVDFFRSVLLSFAEISQAFTFVIYGSSACARDSSNEGFADLMLGSCSVSQGSIFSIVAFGLYLIGGIFLCFSPKQESLCKKGEVDCEPAPAAEVPEQVVEEKPHDFVETGTTEEKPNDVETGAASAEENDSSA